MDKLKAVMLNHDQRILFDNLPKPIIRLGTPYSPMTQSYAFLINQGTYEGNRPLAHATFEKLSKKSSDHQSQIDKNLIKIYQVCMDDEDGAGSN